VADAITKNVPRRDGQECTLKQPVPLRWQRRQAGTLLPLGEITMHESRAPASVDREGKLRRWFLLPQFLGVDAVLGAASGVFVTEER
jgi:hypothetical protein